MVTFTPILKLAMPVFDQDPWDTDINNDMRILDGSIGNFFGIPNFVGLWKNSQAYVVGQTAIDSADSSMWTVKVAHTSAAAPTTFAQDRTNRPNGWTNQIPSASSLAQNAAASAAAAAASAASAAASAAAVAGAVPLSGNVTMTGPLTLSGDPITSSPAHQAATKAYVDARVGGVGFVRTDGTTPMTGMLTLPATAPTALQAVTKTYADTKLPLAGGTLSNFLTLHADPTAPLHAATRQFVLNQVAAGPFLKLATTAQTVTGKVTFSGSIAVGGGIRETTGRIISEFPGLNPSISIHRPNANPALSFAGGMYIDNNTHIRFGNMDGNGIPGTLYAQMHSTGFEILSDGSMGMYSNTGDVGGGVINTFRTAQLAAGYFWNCNINTGLSSIESNNNQLLVLRPDVFLTISGVPVHFSPLTYNGVGPMGGFGPYNDVSDERSKVNIVPMTYAIDTLMGINVIEFDRLNWDGSVGAHDCGFSAQQLQPVYDESVVVAGMKLPDGSGGADTDTPSLAIQNTTILALAIKCLQDLNARVTALEP